MNLSYLGLGIGFVLVGIIALASSRQRQQTPGAEGKAKSSPIGTIGMFLLGLGAVVLIIGL